MKWTIGMLAALAARMAGITALESVWMIRMPSTLRPIIALTCSNCLLSSKFEMFSSVSQPLSLALTRMISMPETQNGETRLSKSRATVLVPLPPYETGMPAVPAASKAPTVKSRRVSFMISSSEMI